MEPAHIKRALLGKFARFLALLFLELDIIAANGMFTRGGASLRLCRQRESSYLAVPVAIDCHVLARHARLGLAFANQNGRLCELQLYSSGRSARFSFPPAQLANRKL